MSVSLRPRVDPATVCRVWRRYLVEVRAAAEGEYEQVEERAWRRLTSNLAALGAPLRDRGDDG